MVFNIQKLQIYKATADFEGGSAFFNNYLKVNEKFLRIRQVVIDRKQPRRIELQHDVEFNEKGDIDYIKFEENFEGIIKSQIFHYRNSVEDIYSAWREYGKHFQRPRQQN